MTAEPLLAHYHEIADAPDAIARLRRFILDLAVRGKLVPQDPKDEPASELLKRIDRDRLTATKQGRFKPISGIPKEASAAGWDIPESWVISPLPGAVYFQEGPGLRNWQFRPSGIPFLNIRTLQNGRVKRELCQFLDPNEVQQKYQHFLVREGDILCSTSGTIGKLAVAEAEDLPLLLNTSIVRLCAYGENGPDVGFIKLFLGTDTFLGQARKHVTGAAQVNMGPSHLKLMAFPLPPLAEQHRIVAKVDELMALCDRLEAARAEREARRDRLAAASLARLNAPDPETFQADAHFALDALAALTTRSDQIKQIRQTILNLAVRGKLVPQDPKDEPASELLKRIAKEKARLVKAGGIHRQKEAVRDPTRLTDKLPTSWSPIALGEVCNLVTSGSRGWAAFYSTSGPGFIRAQNIRFGKLRLDDLAFVNPPSNSEGSRTQVAKGDLLIVITGAGVTNPALLDHDPGEAYVSQHVGLVRPSDQQLSVWLLLCLMADAGGRAELVERAYGAGKPGLNLDNIRSLSVPLPPIAEQQRIVAKVDALMTLCDRLEASLTATAATRRRLLDALLAEALEPSEDRELEAAE